MYIEKYATIFLIVQLYEPGFARNRGITIVGFRWSKWYGIRPLIFHWTVGVGIPIKMTRRWSVKDVIISFIKTFQGYEVFFTKKYFQNKLL